MTLLHDNAVTKATEVARACEEGDRDAREVQRGAGLQDEELLLVHAPPILVFGHAPPVLAP
jgi:hypothetical protein